MNPRLFLLALILAACVIAAFIPFITALITWAVE